MATSVGHTLLTHALDEELLTTVFNKCWDGIGSGLDASGALQTTWTSLAAWRPEITSAVRAMHFYLSIEGTRWASGAVGVTPAMRALGTTWMASKSAAQLAAAMLVERLLANVQGPLAHHLLSLWKLLALVNQALFLADGRYPTLPHRLAGFALASEGRAVPKASQLFLESRKLAWTAVLGLATALAITIDWKALQVYALLMAQRIIGRRKAASSSSSSAVPVLSCSADSISSSSSSSSSMQCVVCGQAAAEAPHQGTGAGTGAGKCAHVFCYLCLQTAGLQQKQKEGQGEEVLCVVCGQPLGDVRPWSKEKDVGL